MCCSFCVCYCVMLLLLSLFFFVKQMTAYDVRISDWSSDVCSSDLQRVAIGQSQQRAGMVQPVREAIDAEALRGNGLFPNLPRHGLRDVHRRDHLAAGADRTSGGAGKRVSERVDLGRRSIIKKKTKTK